MGHVTLLVCCGHSSPLFVNIQSQSTVLETCSAGGTSLGFSDVGQRSVTERNRDFGAAAVVFELSLYDVRLRGPEHGVPPVYDGGLGCAFCRRSRSRCIRVDSRRWKRCPRPCCYLPGQVAIAGADLDIRFAVCSVGYAQNDVYYDIVVL